jgi:hypothetical protein
MRVPSFEADNLLVINYLSASEIWPDKSVWEGTYCIIFPENTEEFVIAWYVPCMVLYKVNMFALIRNLKMVFIKGHTLW